MTTKDRIKDMIETTPKKRRMGGFNGMACIGEDYDVEVIADALISAGLVFKDEVGIDEKGKAIARFMEHLACSFVGITIGFLYGMVVIISLIK